MQVKVAGRDHANERMKPVDSTGEAEEPMPKSLDGLFHTLESPLLLYAMQLVSSNEVAQDLVQEAFLRLHARFGEVKRPRPWLYRTVHNLAMNHHRRLARERPAEDDREGEKDDNLASTELMPDERLERLEAIGLAWLQIEQLENREREVLLLRFEEELSYRQISERTGLTISHVGYLLHQSLKVISGELEKMGIMR